MMRCDAIRTTLEELTLPRLQAGTYRHLHRHIRHCQCCQSFWQHWLRHEQLLGPLLATRPAPETFWEGVMRQVADAASADDSERPWEAFAVSASTHGLHQLSLHQVTVPDSLSGMATRGLTQRVRQQLAEYFRGDRAIFHLPVDLRQCSAFERAVLEAAASIPYGEVRSYKWIAERIGHPTATRAVGNALRKNPLPIVIPCHRVVKSDGSLGGYALGTGWKHRLLALERSTTPFVGCSSTRILCYRGCHHERRVRETNRIHFAHFSEALQSGYRPCLVCQPPQTSWHA